MNTTTPPTPARRTPLQVAEADLLEADDRVDEQTARVLRLEADLGKARAKRQELIRFRDWRAGNPLLDDSADAHVQGIRQRAGAWPAVVEDEEPELEEFIELPRRLCDPPDLVRALPIGSVQLVQARVPEVGDYVMVAVNGREVQGEVYAVDDHDDGRIDVDVRLETIGIVRALLVLPTEKG